MTGVQTCALPISTWRIPKISIAVTNKHNLIIMYDDNTSDRAELFHTVIVPSCTCLGNSIDFVATLFYN